MRKEGGLARKETHLVVVQATQPPGGGMGPRTGRFSCPLHPPSHRGHPQREARLPGALGVQAQVGGRGTLNGLLGVGLPRPVHSLDNHSLTCRDARILLAAFLRKQFAGGFCSQLSMLDRTAGQVSGEIVS